MKKKLIAAALFLSLTVTAIGCGNEGTTGSDAQTTETQTEVEATQETESTLSEEIIGEAVQGDELDTEIHVAVSAAPSTLDCTMTSAVVTKQIAYSNIFESLVTLNSNFGVEAELAETYGISEDNTVYTYTLRKGVLFHNGEELKAADAVASMNRWIENYGNAKSLVGDARFEEVDEYTLQITLDTPSIYLNELIAGAGNAAIIVPAATIETVDAETGTLTEYIGTGPYKFDEWKTDQYIKLVKYDDYVPYGTEGQADGYAGYKQALIPEVYYDFVSDEATRIAGLQTGEYDFAFKLSTDNYDQFNGVSDFIIYNEIAGYPALVYNKKAGLAADPTIRQAVNAALNNEDILLTMYTSPDFYRLDGSLTVQEQAQWYTKAGTENYNLHDQALVDQYLAEAGYNGETFTILVTTDYPEFYAGAIVVQQQLQDAGFTCEVDACDWATFLEKRADENGYNAFITTFSVNALPTQLSFFNPNWAGWVNDEEVLSGIDAFNAADSAETAYQVWEELQRFTIAEGVEISKFGDYQLYSVASAKVNDLSYFQGPIVWNAVIYK